MVGLKCMLHLSLQRLFETISIVIYIEEAMLEDAHRKTYGSS